MSINKIVFKKTTIIILSLCLMFLFSSSLQNVEAQSDTRTISFAVTLEDVGIERELTVKFAELVEEYSEGSMEVERYMGGVLGGEEEILEQMAFGEVDIGYNIVVGSMYYPEYDAMGIPFLWPNEDMILEYLDEILEDIREIAIEDGGVRPIGVFHSYGPRWTSSNIPFSTVEELEGLSIRLPNLPNWIKVWEELGARPTPIAADEIVSALQTGVVDAQENFLTNLYGRSLWEVQEYAIATEHIDQFQTWLVSEMTWQDLSSNEQDILVRAAQDAVDYAKPLIEEQNEEYIKGLEEEGMEIIYPEMEGFYEKAQPAIDEIIEDLNPAARETVIDLLGW